MVVIISKVVTSDLKFMDCQFSTPVSDTEEEDNDKEDNADDNVDDNASDDDAEYYRKEVGEEPGEGACLIVVHKTNYMYIDIYIYISTALHQNHATRFFPKLILSLH